MNELVGYREGGLYILAKTILIVRLVTATVRQPLIVTTLDETVSVQFVFVKEADVNDKLPKVTVEGKVIEILPPTGIGSASVQDIV